MNWQSGILKEVAILATGNRKTVGLQEETNMHHPILNGNFDRVVDEKFSYRGIFLVLELKSGGYLALLPVSGSQTMSWMEATDTHTLKLYFGTLGTKPVAGDVPLVALEQIGRCLRSLQESLGTGHWFKASKRPYRLAVPEEVP